MIRLCFLFTLVCIFRLFSEEGLVSNIEIKRVLPQGEYLVVEDVSENYYLAESLDFLTYEGVAGNRVFGAWMCPNCKWINPYWNNACEKCLESKPEK